MVTRELLHEHLGRRPFQPFRVTLTSGERVDVVRTAQAVATRNQFVVGTPDERLRWIPMEQIDRVDVFELRSPAA